MRKMRTARWFSAIILLIFATLLAACGSASSTSTSSPVTITFQDQFNDAESAKFMTLVNEFEAQNPNIHVQVIRDNSQGYYDKLVTEILGGKGPDIARVEPPKAAQYVGAGYAAPLDQYFPSDMTSQFFSNTLEPLMKDGKLYGVPQDVSALALFYRTDMFKAASLAGPPTTWDELVTDAIKLTKAPNQYGIGLFGGWGAFEFYPWFWQAGGEMLQQTNGKYTAAFNSPEGVKALQFWVDLESKYKVMPPGAATLTEDDMKGPFIAGKLAMFTSGPWVVDSLKQANIDGKWAIAPLPKGDQAASVLGGLDLIMLANSSHKAEAGKFLSWLMQDNVQTDWATSLHYIPVKKSLYDNPAFKSDPLIEEFRAVLDTARSRPTIPQAGEVDSAFGNAVQAALSGTRTPQEALNAAAQQANAALSAS